MDLGAKSRLTVACLQLNTSSDVEANLEKIYDLVGQACQKGAKLLFLPEHTPYILDRELSKFKEHVLSWESKVLSFFANLAKERKIWLNFSMASLDRKKDRLLNRSYLLNSTGEYCASYEKIHLFNTLLDGKEDHHESKIYSPGTDVVISPTPWGTLGFSICYDLRFPLLFREMRKRGADFLCVPSAFTSFTGKAHWHSLLRARAIENGCYVFAPNQFGNLPGGLEAYGHSLIVSPWGEILADHGEGVGFILAEINKDEIFEARSLISSSFFD